MSNIKCILNESSNSQNYAEGYLQYLSRLLKDVDIHKISLFIEELEKARRNHNTTFVIGNGGSAVTAMHMANDLAIGTCVEEDEDPCRVLALTENIAKISAIANDYGYDKSFVRQLKIHYKPEDKLVAISASGNSPNIIAAAEWVKKRKGTVIGFIGFDGGELKSLCDIAIHVVTPKGEYGPVEDIHMIINHLVHIWLRHKRKR